MPRLLHRGLRLLPWAAAAMLSGCQCGDDPFAGRLSENVGASFADCNEARIRFLAAKHNVQLAFAPCGRNAFRSFAWSPDGLRLAFQLVLSTYVMNADAPGRNNITLPIPQGLGPMAWSSPTRLAVAIGPTTDDHPPIRLAIVDLPAPSVDDPAPSPGNLVTVPIQGLARIDDLKALDGGRFLVIGAESDEAPRDAWTVDAGGGPRTRALPWLTPGFDTLSWSAGHVAVSRDGTVAVHAEADGAVEHTFPDATRGVLSPDGTALALETPGPEVGLYGQRAWGEVPEAVREREKRRTEAFEARLPDHLKGRVRPPMISLVPLDAVGDGGERLTATAFMGDGFSWYSAAEGWGTFFLWGFEGRQVKRNVALVDLRTHLDAAREGRARYGTVLHADLDADALADLQEDGPDDAGSTVTAEPTPSEAPAAP